MLLTILQIKQLKSGIPNQPLYSHLNNRSGENFRRGSFLTSIASKNLPISGALAFKGKHICGNSYFYNKCPNGFAVSKVFS